MKTRLHSIFRIVKLRRYTELITLLVADLGDFVYSGLGVVGFILLAAAVLIASAFIVLHDWRLMQLRWATVTPLKCRRYLVARGWVYRGDNRDGVHLDKGNFRILLDCVSLNPATYSVVETVIEDRETDRRHVVVICPGAVEPGLEDKMLSRQVSVITFTELSVIESVLAKHELAMARFKAEEHRLLTEALDPPTPAKLMPTVPQGSRRDVLLAETERVRCYLRDWGSDTLVISFNDSWRCGAGGRLQLNIDANLLGFSIVDFVTKEPNWFPADDMAALIPHLLSHISGRFPQRITFGFSQGGYGAIKFSKALSSTTTIALSPQFSIDPRVVPGNRFSNDFRSHLNVGMAIRTEDCSIRPYVFYDPYDSDDQRQAHQISHQLPITEIKSPFSGHAMLNLFHDAQFFLGLIQSCQISDTATIRMQIAAQRHQRHDRSYLMALNLTQVRPSTALRIAEKHWNNWSNGQKPHVAFRLAAGGHADDALALIQPLAAEHMDDAEIQGCAALVALESSRPGQALTYAERASQSNPMSAKWKHVVNRARECSLRAS